MQALLAEATAVHVQQLDRLRAEAVAVVGEREDNSAPSSVEEPLDDAASDSSVPNIFGGMPF